MELMGVPLRDWMIFGGIVSFLIGNAFGLGVLWTKTMNRLENIERVFKNGLMKRLDDIEEKEDLQDNRLTRIEALMEKKMT